jgi:hypothetical protein
LSVRSRRDYWDRYLSLALIDKDDQDQLILQQIEAWRNYEANQLINQIETTKDVETIEAFLSALLGEDELVRLLHEVVTSACSQSATAWGKEGVPQSVVAVSEIMTTKSSITNDLAATIRDLISKTISKNLPLANSLIQYFGLHYTHGPRILPEKTIAELNHYFHSLLANTFPPSNPSALLRALNGGPSHTLYWSSWGLDRLRNNDTLDLPFDGWPDFSKTILAAAQLDCTTMLPQILPFITATGRSLVLKANRYHEVPASKFDKGAARRLFDYETLMRVFHEFPLAGNLDADIRRSYEAVREAALLHFHSNKQ